MPAVAVDEGWVVKMSCEAVSCINVTSVLEPLSKRLVSMVSTPEVVTVVGWRTSDPAKVPEVLMVTIPRPQSALKTVLLRLPEATVRVMVRLVALTEIFDGAVSEPALTHSPEVACEMVKSEAVRLAEVRVVPEGKVRVMVAVLMRAVGGVKVMRVELLGST